MIHLGKESGRNWASGSERDLGKELGERLGEELGELLGESSTKRCMT